MNSSSSQMKMSWDIDVLNVTLLKRFHKGVLNSVSYCTFEVHKCKQNDIKNYNLQYITKLIIIQNVQFFQPLKGQ